MDLVCSLLASVKKILMNGSRRQRHPTHLCWDPLFRRGPAQDDPHFPGVLDAYLSMVGDDLLSPKEPTPSR